MSRLLTILVLLILSGLIILRRHLVATRNNRKMIQDLAAPESETSLLSQASEEEIGILSKNFEEALGVLKKIRSKGLKGGQYLYELPWYMIIGPPGSGKTTALVNSGLHFPLADRFGNKSLRGVGGTRNCDWWFTEDAVLLDTAGRYTTQDSHQAVDQAAWLGFLGLLKKYRPRRPINGVLVTMSVADILQQTEEERILHARAISQRIQELNKELGIRIPVYMLFTKCDLIAGFNDFFGNLGKEERAQVWGETFPIENPDQPVDFVDSFIENYPDLIGRIDERLISRVQDERDIQRRSLIFGFPQQMFLLKDAIHRFLTEAFGSSRYRSSTLLRGVYFTSGTQEGTPIDRVMGILARSFNMDRQSVPVYSGQGRSYFITRLLHDVIFQESGLTGVDQRIERKQIWTQRIAFGLAIALIGSVVALWSVSFGRNKVAIEEIQNVAARYREAVAETPVPGADLKNQLPRLETAFQAVNVFPESTSWSMGFGLYQGDKLRPMAEAGYERILEKYYLPAIIAELEARIRAGSTGNPDVLYQLLRVYLMFGEPGRMDPQLGRPWISLDWDQRYQSEPEVQDQLLSHLNRLLALKLAAVSLDQSLILRTRRILTQIPVAEQVYARMKSEAFVDTRLDFSVLKAMGQFGDRVFRSSGAGDLARWVIPGLFTHPGYYQVFLKESVILAKDQVKQDWVLGDADPVSPADVQRLQSDLQTLYFQDYIRYWDDLLAKIELREVYSVNQAMDVLEYATGPISPIKNILVAVEKNTALTKAPEGSEAAILNAAQAKSTGLGGRMEKILRLARGDEKKALAVKNPGEVVEQHFAQLNSMVQGETPPIDRILASLSDLYTYMSDLGSTSGGSAALDTAMSRVSQGGGDVISRLGLESKRAPDPLRRWLDAFSVKSSSAILGQAKKALNDLWQSEVYSAYKAGLENRYPLFKDARDEIALDDFSRFFAANGVMDQFFNTHLKAFVDTSRSDWQIKAINQQSIGVSTQTLKQFQYAAKIREVFFRAGTDRPSVKFDLKPVSLDPRVAKFTLDLDGQSDVYRHQPPLAKRFQWPVPDAAGRVRLVSESLNGRMTSQLEEGSWAWFRILDKARFSDTSSADRFQVTFDVEGSVMTYELVAQSVDNPFNLSELENFRCPAKL
ncbi:MAG: type VI secretion system membrane subunit TssM [Methylococcales bacterium]